MKKSQNQQFEVSTDAPPKFIQVPNWLVEKHGKKLGALGIAVYVVLKKFADHKSGECYPSAKTVADLIGVSSRNTIAKALSLLQKVGALRVQKSEQLGGYDHYFVRYFEPTPPCLKIEHPLAQKLSTPCSKIEPVIIEELDPENENQETRTSESLFLTPVVEEKTDDPIPKVFAYFRDKANKSSRYRLTEKRHSMAAKRWSEAVKAEIAEGTPPDQVRTAVSTTFRHIIDEITASRFHIDHGWVQWNQLFSSVEKFETWIERYDDDFAAKNGKGNGHHAQA